MSESRETLVAALSEEIRANQARADAFDEAAGRLLGLNRTDLRVVDIVERSQPIAAGRLAAEAGLTTGAVTAVLDRLEAAGYLRRVRDTADRRRVLVEATPLLRERIEPIWGPVARHAHELFARFDDAELAVVLRFLEAARDVQVAELERVRAMREP